MFLLNLADGKERIRIPEGHFGFHGDISPPPLVLPDGRVLSPFYAKEGTSRQRSPIAVRIGPPTDVGVIDFEKGMMKPLGPAGSLRQPAINRLDDYYQATLGGSYIFGVQGGLGGGCSPYEGRGESFGSAEWWFFAWDNNPRLAEDQRGLPPPLGRRRLIHAAGRRRILNPIGLCVVAMEPTGRQGK